MVKRKNKVVQFTRYNFEQIIVFLFSILPLVDTLNGLYSKLPIGIIYKVSLCGVLLLNTLLRGKISKSSGYIIIFSIAYILLSIFINTLLEGKLISIDYPIKLEFNIVLLLLLFENMKRNKLSGETIYDIIEKSSWVFIGCFLIPYLLGVGNRVYGGEVGYKAFFISQNELGMLTTVMSFFTSYKLIERMQFKDIICISCLFLCGMLLNTKTTIIACIIAILFWVIPIILRSKFSTKIIVALVLIAGFFAFRNRIFMSINAAIGRYSVLLTKSYGGSGVSGILSGRNMYLSSAWNDLYNSHFILRGLIGNGFCSNILIEMDLFDIFFYLGVIGLFFVLYFFAFIFKKTIKNSKYDKSKIRPVSFMFMVGMLTLAGHVIFMSMSGCYFILYICFLMYYKGDLKKKKKSYEVSLSKFTFFR